MTRFRAILAPRDEAASRHETKSLLTSVLIPFGLVLVAVLGLLVQAVPWWVTAVIVSYLVVVSVAVLIPAAIRAYRMMARSVAHRKLARVYLPLIRRFLTTFSPNLEDSRVDTVFYVWKGATSFDQGRGLVKPDQVHLMTLQQWVRSIDDRLRDGGKKNLLRIAEELAGAVLQYSRVCEQAHREIEALKTSECLQDQNCRQLVQEWNNARDKHNQTIKSWEDIAKNINHDAGERVCLDHYGLLKTLG
jgi:hypothetical protein